MALERKTLFERLEIDRDDNVSLLLKKAIVDGDELIIDELHRVRISSGMDLNAALNAVSADLAAQGYPGIPAPVRERVVLAKTFTQSLPAVDKPKRRGPPTR